MYNVATNTWSDIKEACSFGTNNYISGFTIDQNNINIFYWFSAQYPFFQYYLKWIIRDKISNEVIFISSDDPNYPQTLYSTTTANGKSHLPFWWGQYVENFGSGIYRFNELGVSNDQILESQAFVYHINVSSSANDVHVIWKNSSTGYLNYRYDDNAPLAPTNPSLSSNPGNGYVRFGWNANNEPDIAYYEVWRKVNEEGGIWTMIATTTNNYFVDEEYFYAAGAGNFSLTYRVRAKDIQNHYSDYSGEVSVRGEGGRKKGQGKETDEIAFNTLQQNFPNPFNPTTSISYQVKERGFVNLKIFNSLGQEIATLVNAVKESGSYEVKFEGRNLSSGIYFYQLLVNVPNKIVSNGSKEIFTETKRMMLVK